MLPLSELRSEEICSGVIKEQESVAKSADPFIFFFVKITSWIIERKVLKNGKDLHCFT